MFKSLMMLVAGLLVIGLVLMTAVSRSETLQGKLVYRAATAGMSQRFEVTDGLTVMMCGTASSLGNNPDRAQACVAVLTPEHFVVIDSGSGSAGRLVTAGMPLDRLQAVFLTHFHSDHITSLPDLNLNSW
ncbi:MAG: MBL fold metallo-hydrolase, partial [Pseudomonadales bacterium]|nr:MBL fold metallo-hydrolase [Pseudomonadales bacterium]